MDLSPAGKHIVLALAEGWTLKSHRYLDGTKTYQLHPLDGSRPEAVAGEEVESLRDLGLIDSNKKFPAATYLLTAKGQQLSHALTGGDTLPLTATGWQGSD